MLGYITNMSCPFMVGFFSVFPDPKKNINLDQQQEHVKASSCMSWLIINVYNK